MGDFLFWLYDERPLLACMVIVSAGLVLAFIASSLVVLAGNGVWLPLVIAISAPLVRALFMYVRFKNDLR